METELERACRNCAAALHDRYCAACGQDSREPPTRVAPLVAHFVSQAIGFESRALGSFLTLLARPGRLTAAYVTGRRARYSSPIQLYLWCTAGFFLEHAYAPFVRLDAERGTIVSALSGVSVGGELPDELVARLGAQGVPMAAFAQRFGAAVSAYLPVLLVAIVAASAGILALLFRRRAPLTHIVFALHWAAFYFTVEALRRLLPLPAAWELPSEQVLLVLALVYLAAAMVVVYGARPGAAALKALVLVLAFTALLGVWFWSTTELAARLA